MKKQLDMSRSPRGTLRRGVAKIAVEGVLNGSAGGTGGGRDDVGWNLVFELMPWRIVGNDELPALPLRVEVPMRETQIEPWTMRLPDEATVRLAVHRINQRVTYRGKPTSWALAIGRLPIRRVSGSAALQAARAAYQVPVVLRDDVLSRLVLDRRFGSFDGTTKYRGRRVRLTIERSGTTEDPARDQRDIGRARLVIARLARSSSAIDKAIVRDKLRLYNDVWRERRGVLTAKAFLARIRLASMVIGEDGGVTLYFGDGGLFLGHAIVVHIGRRGAISDIELAG